MFKNFCIFYLKCEQLKVISYFIFVESFVKNSINTWTHTIFFLFYESIFVNCFVTCNCYCFESHYFKAFISPHHNFKIHNDQHIFIFIIRLYYNISYIMYALISALLMIIRVIFNMSNQIKQLNNKDNYVIYMVISPNYNARDNHSMILPDTLSSKDNSREASF